MICSKHFHSGKPAKPMDETNIDWVPALYLGYKKLQQIPSHKCSGLKELRIGVKNGAG